MDELINIISSLPHGDVRKNLVDWTEKNLKLISIRTEHYEGVDDEYKKELKDRAIQELTNKVKEYVVIGEPRRKLDADYLINTYYICVVKKEK